MAHGAGYARDPQGLSRGLRHRQSATACRVPPSRVVMMAMSSSVVLHDLDPEGCRFTTMTRVAGVKPLEVVDLPDVGTGRSSTDNPSAPDIRSLPMGSSG